MPDSPRTPPRGQQGHGAPASSTACALPRGHSKLSALEMKKNGLFAPSEETLWLRPWVNWLRRVLDLCLGPGRRGAGTGAGGARARRPSLRDPVSPGDHPPPTFPVHPSPAGSSPRGPARARLTRPAFPASAEARRPNAHFSWSLKLCLSHGCPAGLGPWVPWVISKCQLPSLPQRHPPHTGAPCVRAPTQDGDTGQSSGCANPKAGWGRGSCAKRVRVPWAFQHTGDASS